MNKEKLINQFFEKLLNYAESAESFANKQVPLYVEELLAYGYFDAQISVYFCGVISVLAIILAASFIFIEVRRNWHDFGSFLAAIFVIIAVVSSFHLTENLKKMYKIKNAPRVYILEKLKK